MLDLNLPNFLTVGVISIAAWAMFKYAMQLMGWQIAWI